MSRILQLTIQFEVHPMSDDELQDGMIELGPDDTPESLVEDACVDEIGTALSDYVTSDCNEALAGSEQFVKLKNPAMISATWVTSDDHTAP